MVFVWSADLIRQILPVVLVLRRPNCCNLYLSVSTSVANSTPTVTLRKLQALYLFFDGTLGKVDFGMRVRSA